MEGEFVRDELSVVRGEEEGGVEREEAVGARLVHLGLEIGREVSILSVIGVLEDAGWEG